MKVELSPMEIDLLIRCLELKIAHAYSKLRMKSRPGDCGNEKIDKLRRQRIANCKDLLNKLDGLIGE